MIHRLRRYLQMIWLRWKGLTNDMIVKFLLAGDVELLQ